MSEGGDEAALAASGRMLLEQAEELLELERLREKERQLQKYLKRRRAECESMREELRTLSRQARRERPVVKAELQSESSLIEVKREELQKLLSSAAEEEKARTAALKDVEEAGEKLVVDSKELRVLYEARMGAFREMESMQAGSMQLRRKIESQQTSMKRIREELDRLLEESPLLWLNDEGKRADDESTDLPPLCVSLLHWCRNSFGNDRLLTTCLTSLEGVIFSEFALMPAVRAAGGLQLMIAIIDTHDSPLLHGKACRILWKLCNSSSSCPETIVRAGGLSALLASLSKFTFQPEVQYNAAECLRHLIPPMLQDAGALMGGWRDVLFSSKADGSEDDTKDTPGLLRLRALRRAEEMTADAEGQDVTQWGSTVRLIIAAMELCSVVSRSEADSTIPHKQWAMDSGAVQLERAELAGCQALYNMLLADSYYESIIAQRQYVQLLVRILSGMGSSAGVVLAGMRLLAQMLVCGSTRWSKEDFVRDGVLRLAQDVFRIYSGDADIVELCVPVIEYLGGTVEYDDASSIAYSDSSALFDTGMPLGGSRRLRPLKRRSTTDTGGSSPTAASPLLRRESSRHTVIAALSPKADAEGSARLLPSLSPPAGSGRRRRPSEKRRSLAATGMPPRRSPRRR
eukprot:PLAT1011.1.p1 GENE.PLAT1011.1~~PLAT1011.1.p1  ORF type:complete len:632 (-),score=192.35 PLAT1011.1:80-1975(-)